VPLAGPVAVPAPRRPDDRALLRWAPGSATYHHLRCDHHDPTTKCSSRSAAKAIPSAA
jgi:hypothetical protein